MEEDSNSIPETIGLRNYSKRARLKETGGRALRFFNGSALVTFNCPPGWLGSHLGE